MASERHSRTRSSGASDGDAHFGGRRRPPQKLRRQRRPLLRRARRLYERHLKYDNIVEPDTANTRERYKAAARAVRDILSDRWLRTHKTYARENPKRIYYISIEFLIGRSLGNNVMNLLLDPIVGPSFKGDGREWWEILHEEPDAGLGNGGLGRLAACFLDSMATMQLPAMGYGLRYEHGIFQQKIQNGWQEERPDNWLAYPDPWEIVRPAERRPGEVRLFV